MKKIEARYAIERRVWNGESVRTIWVCDLMGMIVFDSLYEAKDHIMTSLLPVGECEVVKFEIERIVD